MKPTAAFALLDDRHASPAHPTSRLYQRWCHTHTCHDPATLDALGEAVRADQARGLHALLLADYEWGLALQGLPNTAPFDGPPPALRMLMFERLDHLAAHEVDAWLRGQDRGLPEPGPAGWLGLAADTSRTEFDAAIAQIHAAIRAGETYQVNYTHRLRGQAFGAPVALYRRLRARQPAPYGALIALPGGDSGNAGTAGAWLLSCSPELFLRHAAGQLTAQPMKGTAPRSAAQGDAWLRADPKNRAENLMIVDLLRNDLGRLARVGSVRVPRLFEVEDHATVWQMTSTVQAELAPATTLAEVLRATFPCGSITGAPKRRTMQWIQRLEAHPRGLYTGVIGWLDAPAPGRACGDFCLSVAIRTVCLQAEDSATGTRAAELGVGGGIVLDSVADAEFEECRVKARYATELDPGFELFETLWATREDGARHLALHLARLARSATALGFAFDPVEARALIDHTVQTWPTHPPQQPYRLRLALRHGGQLSCSHAPLAALAASASNPVQVLLAPQALSRSDRTPTALRGHKTTLRQAYDAAVRHAEAHGAFDCLFFNAQGRLTEGGRSNVFVKLDGQWFTPPLSDGVLPGVMRSLLLQDPAWAARECSLTQADLQRAEALVLCNALRGAVPAVLA